MTLDGLFVSKVIRECILLHNYSNYAAAKIGYFICPTLSKSYDIRIVIQLMEEILWINQYK